MTSEVGSAHLRVAPQLASGALQGDAASLQHVSPIGHGQGLVGHLLDQQDGHAQRAQAAYGVEDCLDDQGCEAQ